MSEHFVRIVHRDGGEGPEGTEAHRGRVAFAREGDYYTWRYA